MKWTKVKKFSLFAILIMTLVTLNISSVRGGGEKVVYLTFDDGPSPNNTKRIIKTLKEEKVPGTFFLIGENVEKYPKEVENLKKNNMAVGIHSFSHKCSYIYKSSTNYEKDMKKCIESIGKVYGKEYIPIVRMPGGSTNTICKKGVKKQIKKCILDENMHYIDWNVSGEDAIGKNVAKYKIKKNILKGSKNKDCIVVLLHDGYYNSTTADILKEIITYYKDKGYKFKSLKNLSNEDKLRLEKCNIINKK